MGAVTTDTGAFPRISFTRLLWLMPAAYALHIGEEYFGGFQRYVISEMGGPPMRDVPFLINNAVFMAILLALSVRASRRPSPRSAFLLMCWASGNLFWDFLVHLGYTVGTGVFSPGLVTATFFYYPLPFLVTWAAIRDGVLTIRSAIGAFAVGALLMGLVLWGGLYHFRT